ncbi:MAG: VWA domain-containing protein [Myxococcales bacterium]|nr:VWA domain-containing protein [Myxococcales bacterium]
MRSSNLRRGSFALTATATLVLALGACTDTGDFNGTDGDAGGFSEAGVKCDPNTDWDKDGILNGEEGCLTNRDSDNDGTPDWQDFDSDDDGIPDDVEKGQKDANGKCASTGGPWPCDTDKDGYPDYTDIDSDGDGIDDGDEDANGDGLLGCCINECGKPQGKQADGCILTADGCGPGQKCENGKCTPAIGFSCSNGETDPRKKDTFGDGKLDSERGTFICRDATEDKPQGRKAIQTQKNQQGDWHVALEKTAKYGDLKLTNPGPKEAAGVVNEEDQKNEVAGFVLSIDTTEPDVSKAVDQLIQAVQAKVPGGGGTVTVRATGAKGKSHDGYDSVRGTILDIEVSTPSNISTVRNELVGTIMNKPMAQLGNLPAPFGSSHSNFVLRFVTVRRFAFKRTAGKKDLDANGDPIDDGDQTKWRLIVMGGIAGRDNYQDPARATGFIVDDLSNGTALATFKDTVDNECDVGTITSLPVADIVWVIDESGSMSDNRQDIVNNANNFFSRALASGLDFRMGVTNVVTRNSTTYAYAHGKFCSKISTNTSDDGGVDRFLNSTEQAIFSSCINNPPGYEGGSEFPLFNAEEATKKHLPRATNDPSKFRLGASIAFIIATDEFDGDMYSVIGSTNSSQCNVDAATQSNIQAAVQKYIDLWSGKTDPEAVATFHLIGGVCNNSCGAQVNHAMSRIAQSLGGQVGDVCQKDLGNTLQVIIDSIIGAASPVVLEYVPISASLAVALDGIQINRSRTNGFDYRAANNSIALINVQFEKGSELIASYKRWAEQAIVE